MEDRIALFNSSGQLEKKNNLIKSRASWHFKTISYTIMAVWR